MNLVTADTDLIKIARWYLIRVWGDVGGAGINLSCLVVDTDRMREDVYIK